MKMRKGFVSNSSSSSFILANDGEDPRMQRHEDYTLPTYMTIRTKKELEEKLKKTMHIHGNPECLDKCRELIKLGKVLHFTELGNESRSGIPSHIEETLVYREEDRYDVNFEIVDIFGNH